MTVAGWRRILVLAAAVGFVEALLFAVLVPLLPAFEEHLGLSKAGAGLLTAAYAVGAFAGALPSIWAARRLGVKATVLAGLLLLALSSAAFTVPDSAGLVFAARFGQGFGSAFAYTGALAWVTAVAPPARRGEAIGIAFAAAFSGALVGPLVGAAAELAGSALVFSLVAGVALLLALVAAAVEGPPDKGLGTPGVRALASDPVVRIGLWLIALAGLLLGVLGVLGPLRLDVLGWGAAAIGTVFAVAGVLQAAANPVVGRLADTRGGAFPLRAGLMLSAVTSTALVLDARALVYAVIVIMAGAAYATLWTPAMALLSDNVEHRGFDQASGFGLMSAAWPPGFAVGSAAGGALAGATSDAWPYLLGAVACLLSLPLLGRVSQVRS